MSINKLCWSRGETELASVLSDHSSDHYNDSVGSIYHRPSDIVAHIVHLRSIDMFKNIFLSVKALWGLSHMPVSTVGAAQVYLELEQGYIRSSSRRVS